MSMDAFHSAKQRLHKRVMDFASPQELTDDKTMSAHIRYLETIAGRLLRHNKKDAASEVNRRAAKKRIAVSSNPYRSYSLSSLDSNHPAPAGMINRDNIRNSHDTFIHSLGNRLNSAGYV